MKHLLVHDYLIQLVDHTVCKSGFYFHQKHHISVIISVYSEDLNDPADLAYPSDPGNSEDPAGHKA